MRNLLAEQLCAWLSGARRLAVMGVGNTLRGDDGVGLEVARRLAELNSNKFIAVDCGDTPDVFVSEVVRFRPSHVLIVDAADIGERPGATRLFFPRDEEMPSGFISTHEMPLNLAIGMLRLEGDFDIAVLGIQVGQMTLGSEMSPEVRRSAERVTELISENLLLSGILEPTDF